MANKQAGSYLQDAHDLHDGLEIVRHAEDKGRQRLTPG